MTASERPRRSIRSWPLARAPRITIVYLLAADIAALAWSSQALVGTHAGRRAWGVFALLTVLALVFEESARRAARLQLRLSSDLKRDMTSVWCVAAAVGLPRGLGVVLLVILMVYVWFRQQHPAGEILHRKVFNAATALLGFLAAQAVLHSVESSYRHLPFLLPGAVSVALAMLVYTAVNRVLVTLGIMSIGVRGRALIGTLDDNLIEGATLCLGGLVALAALYQPWLAVLVIAPMYTLQRGALVHELEAAASTDAKTGLMNAIAWEQLAQREIARAHREDYMIAVFLIDIDRFKSVNDRFGHLAGDTVLRRVGRALSASVREYDTVGRFGGEEFVAILPDTTEVDALAAAERIRARINSLRVSEVVECVATGGDDSLSVSIGVACMPDDGGELSELLIAADRALYLAKATGRNQVQLAERGAPGSALIG